MFEQLQSVLPKFREACDLEGPNGPYLLEFELTGEQRQYPQNAYFPGLICTDRGGTHRVHVGPTATQKTFVYEFVHREHPDHAPIASRFVELATEAGTALIADPTLRSLQVARFSTPIALWSHFLFATVPQECLDTISFLRRLTHLFAASVRAINGLKPEDDEQRKAHRGNEGMVEWSTPMPRGVCADKFGVPTRKLDAFLVSKGIEVDVINRQSIRVRLDQLDKATRKRFDSPQ